MSNYKKEPLQISASSTGGADVDVSATILVDDQTIQLGDATLVDTHISEQSAELVGSKASGEAKLRLLFVVVPLVGNGEFATTITLSHSALDPNPFSFTKEGDTEGQIKTFSNTFRLP